MMCQAKKVPGPQLTCLPSDPIGRVMQPIWDGVGHVAVGRLWIGRRRVGRIMGRHRRMGIGAGNRGIMRLVISDGAIDCCGVKGLGMWVPGGVAVWNAVDMGMDVGYRSQIVRVRVDSGRVPGLRRGRGGVLRKIRAMVREWHVRCRDRGPVWGRWDRHRGWGGYWLSGAGWCIDVAGCATFSIALLVGTSFDPLLALLPL